MRITAIDQAKQTAISKHHRFACGRCSGCGGAGSAGGGRSLKVKPPFFYWKSPLPLNRPENYPAAAKYTLQPVMQAVRRALGPKFFLIGSISSAPICSFFVSVSTEAARAMHPTCTCRKHALPLGHTV